MTDVSGRGGALASGPESRYVIDALGHLLDGRPAAGRATLDAGAALTSWASVLHRLDVAGRALALDAGIDLHDAARGAGAAAALTGDDTAPAEAIAEVLGAWGAGGGVPVAIDLTVGSTHLAPDADRAYAACVALAWLVDASGFPPQVVA